MKTRIIQIGNSQGVRIPKILLEQSGLSDEVDLKMNNGEIVIKPAKKNRAGWEEAFRKMAEKGDDRLLDAETLSTQSSWDDEEWT